MLVHLWRAQWAVYRVHEHERKLLEALVCARVRAYASPARVIPPRTRIENAQYFAAETIQRHYRAQLLRRCAMTHF
jgi:hypothetical protein